MNLVAVLQLCRISNVLSAVTNVLMGYLWISRSWEPIPIVISLCLASAFFYVAGMVLNDLFDYEHDKKTGARRPLVTGKVSLKAARLIGIGAIALGVLVAVVASVVSANFFESDISLVACFGAISGLCLSIILYDRFSKKTLFAPWLMGCCRVFNVAIGMTAAGWLSSGSGMHGTIADCSLLVGVLFYISGITWYASKETESGNQWRLFIGTSSILAAYFFWASIPWVPDSSLRISGWPRAHDHWFWLLALFMMPAFVRLVIGLVKPTPRNIQRAVIISLYTIIAIDAMFCWLIKSSQPAYTIIVFWMLLPTLGLGRLARPT